MSSYRPDPEIMVPISLGQAERVVQQLVGRKSSGVSLIRLLLSLGGGDRVTMKDLLEDPTASNRYISHNVVVGLLVLSAFHEREPRVADIARELGVSQGTTVRHLKTWVAVGILEQDSGRGKYRIAARWREAFERIVPDDSDFRGE